MMKCDKSLRKLFKSYDNLPQKFVYSSHLIEGEAEHKIMKYLRDQFEQNEDDGVNIIYGADSDLFVLAVLSKVKNLYLYKDNFNTYYNIDKARKIILETMNFEGCDQELLIPDFSVLVFFAGNDFLPQFPNIASSLGSFEIVFDIYKKLGCHLSHQDGSIRFDNYLKLLKEVNRYPYNLYAHFNIGNLAYPYKEVRDHILLKNHLGKTVDENYDPSRHRIDFQFDKFKKVWYHKEFKPRTDVLDEMYPTSKEGDKIYYSNDDIDNMCYTFLQTVQWNHLYYTQGLDKVSNFHFYQYKYTPLTEDLENWMLNNKMRMKEIKKSVLFNLEEKFNIIEQMMMVLPFQSLELIPKEWRESYYSSLKSVNPIDFEILKPEGTNKDFHVIIDIPSIDPLLTKYVFEERGLEIPKSLLPVKELIIFNKDKKMLEWKISDEILM